MRGVKTIDSYGILEALKSNESTAQFADELSIDLLNDFFDYILCSDANHPFPASSQYSQKSCISHRCLHLKNSMLGLNSVSSMISDTLSESVSTT